MANFEITLHEDGSVTISPNQQPGFSDDDLTFDGSIRGSVGSSFSNYAGRKLLEMTGQNIEAEHNRNAERLNANPLNDMARAAFEASLGRIEGFAIASELSVTSDPGLIAHPAVQGTVAAIAVRDIIADAKDAGLSDEEILDYLEEVQRYVFENEISSFSPDWIELIYKKLGEPIGSGPNALFDLGFSIISGLSSLRPSPFSYLGSLIGPAPGAVGPSGLVSPQGSGVLPSIDGSSAGGLVAAAADGGSEYAPTTSLRPVARPTYEAGGYTFHNGGTYGDFSDDYWLFDGQPSKYGPLDRTVEDQVQAWENYDWVFGTNHAAEYQGNPDNDYDGRNVIERTGDAIENSGGGLGGVVNAVGDFLGFDGSIGYDGTYEDDEEETGPILFDLDGNGVQITELSNSSIYVDATGDGLENRTAWAGAGDAVLFYDPDNTGEITEMRQYVFTEWDPTASSDIEALASVFDTNGDGVLDASGDVRRLAANANRPPERLCLRSETR